MPLGLNNSAEKCSVRQTDQPPVESVMADVCLGITVTGLYTLVAMGLTIVKGVAERDNHGIRDARRQASCSASLLMIC
jgi:hypothetical protein